MNAYTKQVFADAGIDTTDLVAIPGAKIHEFMVAATAWLDHDNVLMFVGETPGEMDRFLYYIGEEANRDVVDAGLRIVAFQLDSERGEWLRQKVTGGRAEESTAP